MASPRLLSLLRLFQVCRLRQNWRMPTQLGPGEDIRGARGSPSYPEHFLNRNQEPNGAWARLSQGGCTSGLARKRVGTCKTVGSPVSQAGVAEPALAASSAKRAALDPPALERCGGRGRRGGAGPALQVAAEAEEAAAAPAEGARPGASRGRRREGVFRAFPPGSITSARPRPAPPRPPPLPRPMPGPGGGGSGREGPAPAPLRGVATCSAPHLPLARQ